MPSAFGPPCDRLSRETQNGVQTCHFHSTNQLPITDSMHREQINGCMCFKRESDEEWVRADSRVERVVEFGYR
jgi:hypothetical protein